jgi:PAS domain S-box-containing protein
VASDLDEPERGTTTNPAFWKLFLESRLPMLVLDDDARYTAANEAACRALGRPREDVVGHRMGFTTAVELHSELYELWAGFRRTGHVMVPWRFQLPDGGTVEVEAICTRDTPEPGRHLSLYWQRLRAPDGQTLSPREQQVTRLLASGLTGAQIARLLSLSPETVRTHVRNAMVRMGARTRAQLVAMAIGRGLISEMLD